MILSGHPAFKAWIPAQTHGNDKGAGGSISHGCVHIHPFTHTLPRPITDPRMIHQDAVDPLHRSIPCHRRPSAFHWRPWPAACPPWRRRWVTIPSGGEEHSRRPMGAGWGFGRLGRYVSRVCTRPRTVCAQRAYDVTAHEESFSLEPMVY